MSEQGFTPEFAKAYCAMMLDGILREAETTKKVIGAVPDAASDYKPDPHARTAKELAWHIAHSDVQFIEGIVNLKFEMQKQEQQPETSAEVVAWYDTRMKEAAGHLAGMSAEQLATPISFAGIFNFPAVVYLSFLNNHSIHHRGELATYLRPMGSKVPAIYGGSYDEPFRMPEPAESAA
jgi:uncharacterized damage-inducible protein DinB